MDDAIYETAISGIKFRVLPGEKRCQRCERAGRPKPCGHDYKLEWLTSKGWSTVKMSACFLMGDFFYKNEHALYEPELGFKGGEKFAEAMRRSYRGDWRKEALGVEYERERKLFDGDEA